MQLPELIEAKLIRRYKRFLADVTLPDGQVVTAFVANTGSLLACAEPGQSVWLQDHGDTKRKLRYSWIIGKPGRSMVCVDTGLPNRIVAEAARAQEIPELAGYLEYITEMPIGEGSRADLLCRVHREDMLERCWVEIKATTLAEKDTALFPDSVTVRGRRHLKELSARCADGDRAVQLFFIQRSDCRRFRPAEHIDPQYAKALREAHSAGVEILALQASVTKRAIKIERPIPVEL